MKIEARKLAPIGLYLSLIAAVASIALFIIFRQFNIWLQISLGLIVVGLALFGILDPQRVRVALTGRQARYGSNALILILATLGIVVVANYLVNSHSKRWDLTEDKSNTLTKETLNTLASLKQTVTAEAFFTGGNTSSSTAKTLLDNYKSNSNGKFTYKFIDPNADPVAATQANIKTDGTIVLTMAGRMQAVTVVDEVDLTTGLLRISNPSQRTVLFLTGHGEHNIDDTTGSSSAYTKVKSALTSKNYTVNILNLLAEKKVPDGTNAIVIAGPQKPLSADEVKILQDYLAKGGSLVVEDDPTVITQFGDSADPLETYIAQTWGITLSNDIVIDPTSQQPSQAISYSYGDHPITNQLNKMVTVFPASRSLQTKSTSNIDQVVLVGTSPTAWGETDLTGLMNNQQPAFDSAKDLAGPMTLAVAAVNNNINARMVVIGSSNFAADQGFTLYGNGDFLINSIDWAARQDQLISLTPKQPIQRVLVAPQVYAMGFVLLGSVFALPALVIIAGIVSWVQRRRRG